MMYHEAFVLQTASISISIGAGASADPGVYDSAASICIMISSGYAAIKHQ